MPQLRKAARSYREDANVRAFDDDRPLFLFDGICVLCSSGVGFLMRHDRLGRIRFASAQSKLGTALYAHYGMPIDESYLLIADGQGFTKSDGYFRLLKELGGAWPLLHVLRLIPRFLRDWIYDRVAANRYKWFGKTAYCTLLTPQQRTRLIDG